MIPCSGLFKPWCSRCCNSYKGNKRHSGATFQHSNDESSVVTVGRLFSGTEAGLVDPSDGKDVEDGQEGSSESVGGM